MKIYFSYLCLLFILVACHPKDKTFNLLKQADQLSATAPDSAYAILQSIGQPEDMNNRDFAYWCLISGGIFNHRTDAGKTFLPALFYERAVKYYMKHGTPEEKSYIRLYLGRAYQETAEYNQATSIYTETLNEAIQWQEYNAAGMLCCYLGDIYHTQYYTDKCKEKYREAIDFFKLVNNQRAIALTLADIGFEYLMEKKPADGLIYLLQADSIADLLQDTSLISISLNLGSAYIDLKKFSLAERHLLKALELSNSETDSVTIYYTLSDIYIAAGDYGQAYKVLEQGTNSKTTDGVHYQRYLIEKGRQNFENALVHLERYQKAIDSTQMEQNKMHTLQIEQKYNLEHAENQKNKAIVKAQRSFLFLLIVLTGLLFSIVSYQLMRKQKNKIIAKQREELSKVDGTIAHITTQLQQERQNLKKAQFSLQNTNQSHDVNLSDQQKRIELLRKELFNTRLEKITQVSAVGKKIRRITEKTAPGEKTLTPGEWKALSSLFRTTFPALEPLIWNPDSPLTESEIRSSLLAFFNLEAKQESRILNIEHHSVYKQRTRLRHTLRLDEGAGLFEFLKAYCIEHE